MQSEFSSIVNILKKHFPTLEKDYNVKTLGIFGSFVRNQQDESSDIDILVDFSQSIGFFKFIALENFLSEILNRKVDLITKNALKPAIREEILSEVIPI